MTDNTSPIKLRYYLEYFLVRLLRITLLFMPIDFASYLMGKIWRFLARFNVRHKRVLRHMAWALGDEITPEERQRCALDMWENIGRTFCESLISDRILKQPHRFDTTSDAFQFWRTQCLEGALLVTHHFGNWELVSATTLQATDHKVTGIYKRIKNPLVEAYVLKLRAPLFSGKLLSQQRGAAKESVMSICSGNDMAMVSDLRDNNGTTIRFFDMPASVTDFPEALAVKYKKPLFVAQLRRLKGVHFVLDMKYINLEPTGKFKTDCYNLTQAVHAQFEQWIRDHPEQWMWAPYRWSGRKDDTKKPKSWDQYVALERG